MRTSQLFWILVLIWAAAFGMSFWGLFGMDATGDGLTRGLNRIAAFFGWQLLASFIALCIWLLGRRLDGPPGLRWLARIPGLAAVLLVLGIAGLILWAQITKPGQVAPPASLPVTEPAAPAMPLPKPDQ